MDVEWTAVNKIECLGEIDDYVYDLSISGESEPFFFANDILVHNTDSSVFSAYPAVKEQHVEWDKDTAISLYDNVAEQVNASFPKFLSSTFNVPGKNQNILKAGRELVGDRGIFITKKRYAINIYDKEGKRLDADGKIGKIKAMGLDLKRADTPKYVQDFLMDILTKVLKGIGREVIVEDIRTFKIWLSDQPAWTKGSPRAVNNLTMYGERIKNNVPGPVPGHVRASLNWNSLLEMHKDKFSTKIVDGAKIVVCQLKTNALGYTSIAYPIDQKKLPDWFKELPFDELTMENTLVDEKIDNLIGVLGWDVKQAIDTNSADDLFTFG